MSETGTDETDEHQYQLEAVGLLVAGALSPADRAECEAHLRDCARCQRELVDVAALPGLLGRLHATGSGSWLPAPEPRPGARARLMAAGSAHLKRRRRRVQLAVSAGAVVAAVSLAAPAILPAVLDPQPAQVAMQRVDPAMNVSGTLRVDTVQWGSQLEVAMSWAGGGRAVLVAVGRDGRVDQAASWIAGAGQQVVCRGATSMPAAEIDRFEVRDDDGAALLVL